MITVEQFVDVLKQAESKECFVYYYNGTTKFFIKNIVPLNGYVIFFITALKSRALSIRKLISKLLSQCEPPSHYKILIIGSECYVINNINDIVINKSDVFIKCIEYKFTNDNI